MEWGLLNSYVIMKALLFKALQDSYLFLLQQTNIRTPLDSEDEYFGTLFHKTVIRLWGWNQPMFPLNYTELPSLLYPQPMANSHHSLFDGQRGLPLPTFNRGKARWYPRFKFHIALLIH